MDEVNDLDLAEFCNEEGNVIVEKIVQKFYSNGIILFRDPRLGKIENEGSKSSQK